MYGGDAPEPDPAVGEAAKQNAALGKEYLTWMKGRSRVTDRWAIQDRRRDVHTFRPLQDRFISEAQRWDAPVRQATAAREAAADVAGETARADAQLNRELASMGVNPNSGRSVGEKRSRSVSRGLAIAGAKNMARRGVRDQATALKAQAINLGSGLAINPLSSFTAGTGAGGQGFDGAMRGNESAAGILNDQYRNQLASWSQQQQGVGELFGSLGMAAGMLPWGSILSDEKAKTGRRKARGILKAVREMPVEEWSYKPDAAGGDGGKARHIGPMAQRFKEATGAGDGETINVVDAIGVTLGAVQELDKKVEKLAGGKERGISRKKEAAA